MNSQLFFRLQSWPKVIFGILICSFIVACNAHERVEVEEAPTDWMYVQRAYPNNEFSLEKHQRAVQQVKKVQQRKAQQRGIEEDWQLVGPKNIGGRITSLALDARDERVFYVGTASGGVWKTTDKAETWTPIFENIGSLSIGAMTLAPSNPDIVYVGTGEANGSANSGQFFGDGMYKSINGGETWQHLGLDSTHQIGRIVVDKEDPNRVFVAAMGFLYAKNEQRGLFRTEDGGETWEKILYLNDSTGVIDVVMHGDTLLAATWERIRYPWERDYAGVNSGIFRSLDRGDSWERLGEGLPEPNEQTGRIGLAMAPSSPNVLYACYTTDEIRNYFDGVYRSDDYGTTWRRLRESNLTGVFSSFGWFFGNMRVMPNDPETAFVLGLRLYRTTNGGATWLNIHRDMHVDMHALAFHPANSNFGVAGNDGGIYLTHNGGIDWIPVENLPITQFYQFGVASQRPDWLYGGTQDNNTIRTTTGRDDDWEAILGGDGFHVLIDPNNNNRVYMEYQFGNLFRSLDGGDGFLYALEGIDENDRNNWNTPIALHPIETNVLYYGTQRLYRSNNYASNWQPISEDLTKGIDYSNSGKYATISAIGVATSDINIVYVGTDDGNVQVTQDAGETWSLVSETLPNRFVTDIVVDPLNALTAYVSYSGHRKFDYLPHIFKTNDGGQTWLDISSNLPDVPINELLLDPDLPETIYAATDMGVWVTYDDGLNWDIVGSNMPLVIVTDLAFKPDSRTLLAATFGLSIFSYDLEQTTVTIDNVNVEKEAVLKVYPNPASSYLTIELEDITNVKQLAIYTSTGQLVKRIDHLEANISLTISDLPTGMYLLRATYVDKQLVRKFFVEN